MKLTQDMIREKRNEILAGMSASVKERFGFETADAEVKRAIKAIDEFVAGLNVENFIAILAMQNLIDMEISESVTIEMQITEKIQ